MSRWMMLLLCMLWVMCVWAAPAVKTVTLTDSLGGGWQDELIHYALTFTAGEFTGTALARVEVAGGKALPCQVSDVERFADGSILAMNVWFFATVPDNGTVTYRILPGKRGPADAGVTVTTTGDTLEMTTSVPRTIGIRLLNGSKDYPRPVPASDVPGPLRSLLLPSGRTTGSGHFAVPFKVKAYKAEITANGPLFAEARVHYLFEQGYWTFTARVIRGCPMVRITEEVDTGPSNLTWQTADRFYDFTVNGDGFKPTQAYYASAFTDRYTDLLNKYIQPELKDGLERGGPGSAVSGYTLSLTQEHTDYYLTPWPCWSARAGVAIRFVEPGKDAVGFASVKTTAWRNPLSLRFRTTAAGALTVSLPLQMYRQGWVSEGFDPQSPNYTGRSLGVPATTARRDYGIMLTTAEDEQQAHLHALLRQTAKLGAQPLDEVKDWVLEWPDPLEKAAWAATTGKAGQEALAQMRRWVAAKRAVGNFGSFSMWTYESFMLYRYKQLLPVLDTPAELSATYRRALRRLCAFQAYVLNSLDEFPWGAGAHLGTPNMCCMAMVARAQSAALVKDHPQYHTWGDWTLAFTRDYLERYTRESGAPYECPHYTTGVTLRDTTELQQTLQQAGIGDAFATPRFKAGMQCLLDFSMPPDPRMTNHRMMLPFGNGYPYESFPREVFQRLISYWQDRDTHLAGQLQWVVNRSQPDDKQLAIVKDEAPVLRSKWYQDFGVFMRQGFNTPYETCLFLMAGNCDGHYEAETEQMAYTLTAKGQPINLHFNNGYIPMFFRPWLRNRVSIDHMVEESERNATRVQAAAFSPEADYAHAARDIDSIRPLATEYPITTNKGTAWAPEESARNWPAVPAWQRIPLTVWHRQILFLKDADPKGPNYFVLRDTFGGAPERRTDLSLWFLASGMSGQAPLYHFEGQCDVNMDLFVASPHDNTPETGQYGHPMIPYSRPVKSDPKYFPEGKTDSEVQHFIRFAQPAGQGYLLALYPRLKGLDPPAEFTTPAESVIRAVTPLSTDYAFLNSAAFDFKDERVTFHGMAGAVRIYKSGKIAVVNAEGHADFTVAGKSISGDGPFTVIIEHETVTTTPPEARVTVK